MFGSNSDVLAQTFSASAQKLSPFFGDGARMAFTPNFRKVGSLLAGELFELLETCVLATVVVAMRSGKLWVTCMLWADGIGGEALVGAAGRLKYAVGLPRRRRSSTMKPE